MKDFSNWKIYEGAAEGSGRSEKIWLIEPESGQIGLFKFKKDRTTTDHISECIAYDLASTLGISCAKFEAGKYNGRQGVLSYNIIRSDEEYLIEGINFINAEYPEYDEEAFIDKISGDRYSIEMIDKVMSRYTDFSAFLIIPVFDYLIGNTDRHQSNWAILMDNKKNTFSPLYDNSSSLCAYVSEEQADTYLGRDKNKWRSLVDTKSKSLIRRTLHDEKRPTHLDILKYLKKMYYTETVELVKEIVSALSENIIDGILNKYSEDGLSEKKKIVIKRFLLDKVEMMKQVYESEEV
ncbi:MAG: HipA domain-containing protein [Lachnospiraceae bacterium]|nr:HipA domain-containing protein [Lachnospiraceae bacterium]